MRSSVHGTISFPFCFSVQGLCQRLKKMNFNNKSDLLLEEEDIRRQTLVSLCNDNLLQLGFLRHFYSLMSVGTEVRC